MQTLYSGIFNDNGKEMIMKVYLDLNNANPYHCTGTVDQKNVEFRFSNMQLTFLGSDYDIEIFHFNNEVIIQGEKAEGCLSCLIKDQKMFMISDKVQVDSNNKFYNFMMA